MNASREKPDFPKEFTPGSPGVGIREDEKMTPLESQDCHHVLHIM
jgi:hypothetical protein